MTATDELRRLLDRRGVEWENRDGFNDWKTCWEHGKAGLTFTENKRSGFTTLEAYQLTPAQAVEATLGKGMLTADDVRDLIERHSDASGGNGRDFHNGAYVSMADELNAMLGRGTCRAIISDNLNESEGMGDAWANCSECGYLLYVLTDPNSEPSNYCPNCGREVER